MKRYSQAIKCHDHYICNNCDKRIPAPFKRREGEAVQLLLRCPHCHLELIWPLTNEEMDAL